YSAQATPYSANVAGNSGGIAFMVVRSSQLEEARGAAVDGQADEALLALVADIAEDDAGAVMLGAHLGQLLVGFDAADEAVAVRAFDHGQEAHGGAQLERAAERRQRHQIVLQADFAFRRPAVHLGGGDEEAGHGANYSSVGRLRPTQANAKRASTPTTESARPR